MKDLEQLCKDYPELYTDVYFEHNAGWYDILEGLALRFREILKDNVEGEVEVLQVKEKFGGLRFYAATYGCTEEQEKAIRVAIQIAENVSFKTCELCGKAGREISNTGWIVTRCEECVK